MFIKAIFKSSNDVKRIRNCVPKQNLFLYFLIQQNLLFPADISRAGRVFHVIHILFGSSLGMVQLCQVSSLHDMSDRFQGGEFFVPHHPRAAPKRPILIRVKSCKKMMEFFFSKVSGYNLTKKGIHQRFFLVKFVKLFRAVLNQNNFWQMIEHRVGLYAISVFLRLLFDNFPSGVLSKQ